MKVLCFFLVNLSLAISSEKYVPHWLVKLTSGTNADTVAHASGLVNEGQVYNIYKPLT